MGTRRIRRSDGDFTLFFRKVSPFSNHHPAEFDSNQAINFRETKRFSCTEQFYMYNKASLLKDTELMEAVLESESPREMKTMCSKNNLRGWSDSVWNEHKENVMYKGCLAKFQASRELRYALFLSTGSQLIECNPYDSIWGIGKDLEAAESSSLDSGQNLLGKILDRVREELWENEIYREEREEIEKRMREDEHYLTKAMKHVDLLYKERATFRYQAARHGDEDTLEYVTSEMKSLLPEWAIPSPVSENEPIRPTPPQIVKFPTTPPIQAESANGSRRNSTNSTRNGRHSAADRRSPGERRRANNSRNENRRSRSRSPRRQRSRSRSPHVDRRSPIRNERRRSPIRHQRRSPIRRNRSRSPPRRFENNGRRENRPFQRATYIGYRGPVRRSVDDRRPRNYSPIRRMDDRRDRVDNRRVERSRSREGSRRNRRNHNRSPSPQQPQPKREAVVIVLSSDTSQAQSEENREARNRRRSSRSRSREERKNYLKKMEKLLKQRAREKRRNPNRQRASSSNSSTN
uniref:DUF1768 domain-containing protein n=1 Tax=Caenorhabditis tropicalis TaxID=1561998 RepID=A0A1I7UQF0_9PELO